jgi:hypothetical protein
MPSKNIIRFLRFTIVGFSSYFSIFLFYLCFEEIIAHAVFKRAFS